MSIKINKEEYSKVNYLKLDNLQGRAIPMYACYHEDCTWELWIPDNNDHLIKMVPTAMAEGKYYAKSLYKDTDVYLYFFDFMCKRAYWEEIVPFIEGIYDDLQNIGSPMAKLDIIFAEWKRTKCDSRRYVVTEIEYLFTVCRSLFDLLQECISKMWPKFKFHDITLGKNTLPPSFRKMILEDKKVMSVERISQKYRLPIVLAEYYNKQAEFFIWLRDFRDHILHSGQSIEYLFSIEKGFAISIDVKPFSSMNIWSTSNIENYKLGSVKSLIAFIVQKTFLSIEEFTHLIETIIIFPDDIAPDYKLFICGANTGKLQNVERYISAEPWYS